MALAQVENYKFFVHFLLFFCLTTRPSAQRYVLYFQRRVGHVMSGCLCQFLCVSLSPSVCLGVSASVSLSLPYIHVSFHFLRRWFFWWFMETFTRCYNDSKSEFCLFAYWTWIGVAILHFLLGLLILPSDSLKARVFLPVVTVLVGCQSCLLRNLCRLPPREPEKEAEEEAEKELKEEAEVEVEGKAEDEVDVVVMEEAEEEAEGKAEEELEEELEEEAAVEGRIQNKNPLKRKPRKTKENERQKQKNQERKTLRLSSQFAGHVYFARSRRLPFSFTHGKS